MNFYYKSYFSISYNYINCTIKYFTIQYRIIAFMIVIIYIYILLLLLSCIYIYYIEYISLNIDI